MSFAFPGDVYENGEVGRYGAWLTLGYRPEKSSVDVLTLFRLLRNRQGVDQNLFDVGGRLVWKIDRFELSGEYVRRTVYDIRERTTTPDHTIRGIIEYETSYRLSGNLTFHLTDDVTVTTALGRDFKTNSFLRKTLIALIGLSIQMGKRPTIVR